MTPYPYPSYFLPGPVQFTCLRHTLKLFGLSFYKADIGNRRTYLDRWLLAPPLHGGRINTTVDLEGYCTEIQEYRFLFHPEKEEVRNHFLSLISPPSPARLLDKSTRESISEFGISQGIRFVFSVVEVANHLRNVEPEELDKIRFYDLTSAGVIPLLNRILHDIERGRKKEAEQATEKLLFLLKKHPSTERNLQRKNPSEWKKFKETELYEKHRIS